MKEHDILHRYEDGFEVNGVVYLRLLQLIVERRTPTGYWCRYRGRRTWRKTRGNFAHVRIEDALTSYKYRKKRHIHILKAQLRNAEASLAAARSDTLQFQVERDRMVALDLPPQ